MDHIFVFVTFIELLKLEIKIKFKILIRIFVSQYIPLCGHSPIFWFSCPMYHVHFGSGFDAGLSLQAREKLVSDAKSVKLTDIHVSYSVKLS